MTVNALINDIVGLEKKYQGNFKEISTSHILRIYRIINVLDDEAKDRVSIYISKFKTMVGDKSWSTEDLEVEMCNFARLFKHGIKIIMYVTCTELTDKMSNLILQSNFVELNYQGDFSPIRARLDFLLTKAVRELLPSLISQKAVCGDILEESDEFIY
jgi:hypothetical protein